MSNVIKVVLLSKACITALYRGKLSEISKHRDIDLTVIVPSEWRDERGVLSFESDGLKEYKVLVEPIVFNGSYHFHFYPTLAKRLEQIQPDILHVEEEPYNFATWHAIRVSRLICCKTLFFSWQNIHKTYPWPFSFMESHVLQSVDAAIFGSESSLRVFHAKGYSGPSEVIPQFGVDTNIFELSNKTDSCKNQFNIGYIGRLVNEKGVDMLISVLTMMPDDVRLNVYGSGPDLEYLKQLVFNYNLYNEVIFTPWISSTKIPQLMHNFDVLVLPSRTTTKWKEQFGRVLIEAMASGIPVVGSDSGEIPYVIGDAGLIFQEGDVESLKDALMKLYVDPDLRNLLSLQGRKRVQDRFTHSIVANRTVDLYRTIVEC